MIGFLKSFLSGEKSSEEQALLKKHDVMKIESVCDEEPEAQAACAPKGCGGCGCG